LIIAQARKSVRVFQEKRPLADAARISPCLFDEAAIPADWYNSITAKITDTNWAMNRAE
jgi:hypothetical protein